MTDAGPAPLTPRALERRVKRWLLGSPFDCFIQCPVGLEDVLAEELRDLDIGSVDDREVGGVSARLTAVQIARANLELRTATRVLLRLGEFYAGSSEALFDHVRHVPWEVQLGSKGEYRLNVTSRLSALQAGDGVMRTISLGIGRRLTELGGAASLAANEDRPDVPEFSFRFHNDRCYVSLNTSGEPLHRRGVRRHIGAAPLRESIAAAMVLTAYSGHSVVLDPFCGSGTVLIEASDLINGRLPGRGRDFYLKHAPWFRPGMWNEALRRAETARRPAANAQLIGCDIDPSALRAAASNLASSPDYQGIELQRRDSSKIDLDAFLPSGAPERGLLVSNLPYGVRIADRSGAAEVITAFLNRCETAAKPWDFVFLTQHPGLFRGRQRTRVTSETALNSGGLRVQMISGTIGGTDGGTGAT
ncbi:MAG: hypothetical protein KF813_05990 [Trueperaceae bacterium]|nr:hypothetical protein [Trueperaceae bacterium]